MEEKFPNRDTGVNDQQAALLAAGWRTASVSVLPSLEGDPGSWWGWGGYKAAATANSFPKVRLLFREYNYILIYVCRLFSLKVIIISTSISNVWECLFPWILTSTWYCFSKHLTVIHYCYFKLHFPDSYWDWRASHVALVGQTPPANAEDLRDPRVRMIPWKRKWQPTPVFSFGESHGQRGLAGYSP